MPDNLKRHDEANSPSDSSNRRRHARFGIGAHATLHCGDFSSEGTIVDVSANGIAMMGGFNLNVGDLAEVSHPVWGTVTGRVTRASQGFVAINFDVALDSATFAIKAVLREAASA